MTEAHEPGARHERQSGALLVIFLTILIDFLGFSVLVPVLAAYADRLGASATQVSLMLSVYALAQLLFLPLWGWVSDRVGRRPVILVSLAGTAGSFILLATAETLTWIYVARALGGFFAASVGTAQAVVTDVTPASERTRGMGRVGAAIGVGIALGPALGGLLAIVDPKAPFYAVAIIAGVNFVLAAWLLPETRPSQLRPPTRTDLAGLLIPAPLRLFTAKHDRRTALYLYLFLHIFTALAVLESVLPLVLVRSFGATEWGIGKIFGTMGVVITLTQGVLLGQLARSVRERTLVISGLLLTACGLGAIAFVPALGWFYGIGILIAIGNGIAFPAFTSIYSKVVEGDETGELLGESQSLATTGRVVGAYGAGAAMDALGASAPFLIASGLMAIAAVLFLAARPILMIRS